MQITFVHADSAAHGQALALLCFEDEAPGPAAAAFDAASGGALTRALGHGRFTGKKGATLDLIAPAGEIASRVVAVGAGPRADLDALGIEHAAATAFHALKTSGAATLTVAFDVDAEGAARVAYGVELAAYRFDRYRTREKPEAKPTVTSVRIAAADPVAAEAAFAPLAAVAQGVAFTRDLVSEPPNILFPEEFARRVAESAGPLGLDVEILDEPAMEALGMGSLLAVGYGSARASRLAVIRWNGADDAAAPSIAFVGKGVTFDTGGISIKPADGMDDMKFDMGGAGTVAGLMVALAVRKAKVNAVGILGLVENMPDGKAMRPGDVLTSMSGQTIEVLNTDAEGRLVLADALWYCQDRFKPRFMIDLATLTGAIIVGLGSDIAGLFTADDALNDALLAASKAEGEQVWRMPLPAAYDKLIDSPVADMKNIGGRAGGSITAALFLKRFTNDVPWAHLDIAGVAWRKGPGAPTYPEGATGFGVRLLDRLVRDGFEGVSDAAVEVWFYHLEWSNADEVLPPLLDRTLQRGWRALVRTGDAARLAALDARLWTARPDLVLPHGLADEPNAELQPIVLTAGGENPNGAHALFLVDGAEAGALDGFARVLDLFDGRDDASLAAARERWKRLKAQGAALSYWTQTEAGRWEKRA